MPAPNPSALDGNQVLQHAFDDASGKLRVDATVSASVGTVQIEDADGDQLEINNDGSLNAVISGTTSIEIDAADGDNIAISDGVNTMDVNPDGSINSVVSATDLDIRDLVFATDKVDVSGSSVAISSSALPVGAATEAKQDVGNTNLASIDGKLNSLGQKVMSGSVPVVISSDQSKVNVGNINDLIPVEYDEINIVTKNSNGDPTSILFKKTAATVATLTLTYDSDGDLQNVLRS